jgi:L-threonylcarbamoyladenylate synthase
MPSCSVFPVSATGTVMTPVPVHRPPLPILARINWPEDVQTPDPATAAALAAAAERLANGQLVAIPTETVYGLAADAMEPDAVAQIFHVKGRPATNPLIVHVSDQSMAQTLTSQWPDIAKKAADAFWPGPLTLVVPKADAVPDIVTAGGHTVALRCPSLKVTHHLIRLSQRPLAAPSANRSEAVSPTTAQHVLEGLGNRIGMILDGGPCEHGLESTVLDCTVDPPKVLRPGPISSEQLAKVLGTNVCSSESEPVRAGQGGEASPVLRSPGTQPRHYAPRTQLTVTENAPSVIPRLIQDGHRVGWLCNSPEDRAVQSLAASPDLLVIPMPTQPTAYARSLYATLHALDQRELDRLIVDAVPSGPEWTAIRDRLNRAAT